MDSAAREMGRLLRSGKVILLIVGAIGLAMLVATIFAVDSIRSSNSLLVLLDYAIVIGIGGPGVTLFVLRLYTNRTLAGGNAKVFSKKRILLFVSVSWVCLALVLALSVVRV